MEIDKRCIYVCIDKIETNGMPESDSGGAGYLPGRIFLEKHDNKNVIQNKRTIAWPSNAKFIKSTIDGAKRTNGIYGYALRFPNEYEIKQFMIHGDHILKKDIKQKIKEFKV